MKVRILGRRMGQAAAPLVVLLSALAASPLWFRLRGLGPLQALAIAALLPVAAVLGVAVHARLRSRARWQAAWDAYAAWDLSGGAQQPAGLSLGTR